jgi:hypothetical protein
MESMAIAEGRKSTEWTEWHILATFFKKMFPHSHFLEDCCQIKVTEE